MGWHKKSLKKSDKVNHVAETDSNVTDENVQSSVETNSNSKKDEKVKTLLAKALFDNLADAPDELSFRKGDIVTVIEQDVDGIKGWWLCLLHGRQGIVPGNRLKVIPPVELDQFEKNSKRRESYETDEFSDSTDFMENAGGNYDFLPAPVKANNYPQPLSIKDMFNIPYKIEKEEVYQEIYDVPKNKNTNQVQNQPQEIYDVPKNKNTNQVQNQPQEIYDIPKDKNTNQVQNQPQEIYDIPKDKNTNQVQNEPQEIYDIPKDRNTNHVQNQPQEIYDNPKDRNTNHVQNQPQEIYDIPKDRNTNQVQNQPQEIYDIPKDKKQNQLQEIYDVPKSNSGTPAQEIYDVPVTKRKSDVVEPTELYDIPKPSTYDSPKTSVHTLTSAPIDLSILNTTELQKADSVLDMDKLMGEIYDSPFSADTNANTIKRSPRNSNSSTPRNSMQAANGFEQSPTKRESQEIYDIPRKSSFELYDTPSSIKQLPSETNNIPSVNTSLQATQKEVYDTPTSTNGLATTVRTVFEETYDVPLSKTLKRGTPPLKLNDNSRITAQTLPRTFSPKTMTPHKGTFLQEIYDIPSTSLNRSPLSSAQNTPIMERKKPAIAEEVNGSPQNSQSRAALNKSMSQPDEVNSEELYSVPVKRDSSAGQEIYDTPKNNTLKRNQFSNVREAEIEPHQELYDVPSHHDLRQVMADVNKAYSSHPRGVNRSLGNNLIPPGALEDDYVDYHDIWSNQPPVDLVKEHTKSISTRDDLSPVESPTSRKRFSSEHKKSILDQINFEAVKELHMTTSEAIERLGKLHLAVDTCVKTLATYCNDNWLDIPVLSNTIQPIRDFSGKLKTALRLLTEFGLGTLVNTTKNINGEILMDKLIGEVEPLLESYYKIKICLMHLDSNNWYVPDVRTSSNEKFFATLNAIMILSQRIPDQCRLFNLAVQNNANELFDPDPVSNIAKQIGNLLSQARDESPTQEVYSPARQGYSPAHLSTPQGYLPTQENQKNHSGVKHSLSNEYPPTTDTLRRQTGSNTLRRRQQARDVGSGTLRPAPRLPPKPSLPDVSTRRSLAGNIDPPESQKPNLNNRGFGHIERLVTDYQPENTRQKKYASDPATPSHTDGQKAMWGGSLPTLLNRNSAAAYSPLRGEESTSSSSSVGASIPEETIEIKQTSNDVGHFYPSDSNILSPTLSPMHTRSASMPWDDRLKNAFTFEEEGLKSPQISILDHRDIESLEFFCRQVESQVILLRDSIKNLTEAVENREEPAAFVSHSKFIILTAHKVVNGGQEITGRLINKEIRGKLKNGTAHLTICIRGVVASTKSAALEYPEPTSMMEMISSALALGDAVRIIHSECRRALNA